MADDLLRFVQLVGERRIAAVFVEPIAGSTGVLVPPVGYLERIREICDRYGIVYIADEVMAGFGRTGKWFAFENYGAVPDLIAFAKGVNCGYVPLGGVVLNEAISASFNDRAYPGGLTYSGHPLACAATVACIEAMQDEQIIENAKRIGESAAGAVLRPIRELHHEFTVLDGSQFQYAF